MVSIVQPARALLDPRDAVHDAVTSRRWVFPLLLLMLAVSFSGAAFATRWEAGPATIRELTQSDEISRVTEKELSDKIKTAGRVKLVGGVARGVFVVPLIVLLFTVAVKVSGWLIGRSIKFMSAFSAVTVALLPIALFHLLYGGVALASFSLSESGADGVLPSHLGHLVKASTPEIGRLLSVVDLFNLWAAVLLGLGFSAGTGVSKTKGIVFGLVLYIAWAGVFLVGLPGMGGGK